LPLRVDCAWNEIERALAGGAVFVAEAGGETRYDQVDWARPSALIVGSEAHGPSPTARRLATGRVAIPMAGAVESLNVAVAASVILFEAARQVARHG